MVLPPSVPLVFVPPTSPICLPGLRIGHATHVLRPTGCTVWLCPPATVGAVAVMGAAPGTRETDVLHPDNTVDQVHAVCLSGGSAFGLDAASGVMQWLDQRGVGVTVGPAQVPIVPAAVIFDLGVGDPRIRPNAALGQQACDAASPLGVASGNVGAGAGATVGKLRGPRQAMRGGFGQAMVFVGDLQVAAWVVLNAVGDVWDPHQHRWLAGARHQPDGLLLDPVWPSLSHSSPQVHHAWLGGNTTLAVVATNQRLNKLQTHQLAQRAHHGLVHTIKPVHTPYDGDAVFALSTGTCQTSTHAVQLGSLAAQAVSLAVVDAVKSAQGLHLDCPEGSGWWPAWQDLPTPPRFFDPAAPSSSTTTTQRL